MTRRGGASPRLGKKRERQGPPLCGSCRQPGHNARTCPSKGTGAKKQRIDDGSQDAASSKRTKAPTTLDDTFKKVDESLVDEAKKPSFGVDADTESLEETLRMDLDLATASAEVGIKRGEELLAMDSGYEGDGGVDDAALQTANDKEENNEALFSLLDDLTAKDSITPATLKDHKRWMGRYKEFCSTNGLDPLTMDEVAGKQISAFIHLKCDVLPECENLSFSTAAKIRAAVAFMYAAERGQYGAWQKNGPNGTRTGNPSLSREVTMFMRSLLRRKVKAGVTIKQAKPMRESILYTWAKYLYGDSATNDFSLMMLALYLVAFHLMLSADEVLSLRVEDLSAEPSGPEIGEKRIHVSLVGRKTHQEGYRRAMFLDCMCGLNAYLCGHCFLARWLGVLQNRTGPVFPKFSFVSKPGPDGTTHNAFTVSKDGSHLDAATFSKQLKRDLEAIGEYAPVYGTHSFRRGGTIFKCKIGWPVGAIIDLGGWGLTSITLLRYLYYRYNQGFEYRSV